MTASVPPSVASAVRRAKEAGDLPGLVASIPYFRFLGFTADVSSGDLVGKLAYADTLIGNAALPALHGGTIGALLESTAMLMALWESETMMLPKIVTLTVDFLRSGRPVDTFAQGVFAKQGRRIVNVAVEAWQEERARPIARAQAIFLVEPFTSAGAASP
jgi:acyl-coenzyme A thioesterase PaaI-like protein